MSKRVIFALPEKNGDVSRLWDGAKALSLRTLELMRKIYVEVDFKCSDQSKFPMKEDAGEASAVMTMMRTKETK